MHNLAVPLGSSLIALSFLLTQIHPAAAACTNETAYIMQTIELYNSSPKDKDNPPLKDTHIGARGRTTTAQLAFLSCPSAPNVSCTLPPATYTVAITPRLNISTAGPVKGPDYVGLDALIRGSHALDLPLDSPDGKAIVEHIQVGGLPEAHLATAPFTLELTTQNISHYADLTVAPGYNMTLTYVTFMATTWVTYAQCENASLDGALIGAMIPYYSFPPDAGSPNRTANDTRLAGEFVVDWMLLNDSVPETKDGGGETKDGGGAGLKAGSGWAAALVAGGVLAFSWL